MLAENERLGPLIGMCLATSLSSSQDKPRWRLRGSLDPSLRLLYKLTPVARSLTPALGGIPWNLRPTFRSPTPLRPPYLHSPAKTQPYRTPKLDKNGWHLWIEGRHGGEHLAVAIRHGLLRGMRRPSPEDRRETVSVGPAQELSHESWPSAVWGAEDTSSSA